MSDHLKRLKCELWMLLILEELYQADIKKHFKFETKLDKTLQDFINQIKEQIDNIQEPNPQ
jgi:hypothetical protein